MFEILKHLILAIIITFVAAIVILVVFASVISSPSRERVTNDFEQDQAKIDQLVQVFQQTSKVASIDRSLVDSIFGHWGSVSLRYFETDLKNNSELPTIRIHGLRPGGERIRQVLEVVSMSNDKFDVILANMRRADVRAIRFNDGEEKKFVEVAYPDMRVGLGCSWKFVTPIKPHTVQEIANGESLVTDEEEGEEGPYILDERWLVYKRCVS